MNKKGDVDVGAPIGTMGKIILILIFLGVILAIILIWANPAFSDNLKSFDFW